METYLQTILWVDKKNPHFTLIKDSMKKIINVYFGAVLLEVIDDTPNNLNLKFMIARLFNARVNKQNLVKVFGYCYNTIKRWAEALKTNDALTIVDALSGQGAPKKLTVEIQSYVTHRFKSVFVENKYSYSKEIRIEIQDVFNQDISAETLRPLFNKLKEKYFTSKRKIIPVQETPSFPALFGHDQQLALPAAKPVLALPAHQGNLSLRFSALFPDVQFPSSPLPDFTPSCPPCSPAENTALQLPFSYSKPEFEFTFDCDSNLNNKDNKLDTENNRKISENNEMSTEGFFYHAGVLMFAPYLYLLQKSSLGDCIPQIMQWLVAILLGARNIEQSKLLNYKSLDLFLNNPIRNLHSQRKKLKEFANEDNFGKLLNFNAILVNVSKQTDFYYDPHTKHYTGLLEILKSWCSKVRMAAKVINTDFIHTVDGFAVYIKNGDTFDDMRVRFFKDIKEFRKTTEMPDDKIITICVDRGIYSTEVFGDAARTNNLHVISWEKGYKNDKWDENKTTKTGSLIQTRNNKTDTKLITYQYQELRWEKNDKIRQLIVRIPEKNGKGVIELSILTDDLYRQATEIIFIMLKRWVQENDFKYLIAHFGLDQITSYLFDDYKDIADTVTDKEHVSGRYKAMTKELKKIRGKLKTALQKKHESDAKFGIYQDISELIKEKSEILFNGFTVELAGVNVEKSKKKPTKKQKENYKKNVDRIVELTNQYVEKFNERADIDKNVSKIEELKKKETKKLDTAQKQLMDIIKIIARNIFYLAFEPFKEKYNNYRDDHVVFREMTRANGRIEINNSHIVVEILPKMEIPPKVRKILSEIFEEINKKNIPLPNNEKLKIKLEISEKIHSFFAFAN